MASAASQASVRAAGEKEGWAAGAERPCGGGGTRSGAGLGGFLAFPTQCSPFNRKGVSGGLDCADVEKEAQRGSMTGSGSCK